MLGHLGVILGSLGAILALSWCSLVGLLGRSWGFFGVLHQEYPRKAFLALSLGRLEIILVGFVDFLVHFGSHLEGLVRSAWGHVGVLSVYSCRKIPERLLLGIAWGLLGVLLELSWAIFGPSRS